MISWPGGERRSAVLLWPGSPHLAGHRQPAAQPVRPLTDAERTSTRRDRRPGLRPVHATVARTTATRAGTTTAAGHTASCSCCLAFGLVAVAGRGDLGDELAHPAAGQAEPPGHGPLAQRLPGRDRRR